MSSDRILSQILGSSAASGFAGGLAGGLASGLLTSKAGRKFGKKALRVGGVAAVGGLAYAAWSRYRQEQAAHAPPGAAARPAPFSNATAAPATAADDVTLERFVPPPSRPEECEALGLALLRAMIAAAQADGKLDGAERRAIFERISTLELSAAEQAALFEQLDQPVDLNALVAAARTPEQAIEIYTASRLAIEVDTPAERGYLAMLAARLELPDQLVGAIDREVAGGADPVAPPETAGATGVSSAPRAARACGGTASGT